jgi:hypothetical protein
VRIVKERSKESEAQGWKEAMRDCKTKKGCIDYHLMTVRIILFFSGWIVPAHCMYCIASYWIGYAEKERGYDRTRYSWKNKSDSSTSWMWWYSILRSLSGIAYSR